MRASDFSGVPLAPPDVAVWEELLIRVEVGPRVVRVALDSAAHEALRPVAGPHDPSVAWHLDHLACRERIAAGWLAAMRDGEPLPPEEPAGAGGPDGRVASVADGRPAQPDGSGRDALRSFTELRARNFAAVQRRGLEVWDWRAEHPEVGAVSPYRLLCHLAAHDGRHLARIRAALGGSR